MKIFIQNQPVLKTLIKLLPAVLNKLFQFVTWCVMYDLWLTNEKNYSKPAYSGNTDQTSTGHVEKNCFSGLSSL